MRKGLEGHSGSLPDAGNDMGYIWTRSCRLVRARSLRDVQPLLVTRMLKNDREQRKRQLHRISLEESEAGFDGLI
jgi:hypothetical protein